MVCTDTHVSQDVKLLSAWAAKNPGGAADFLALPRTRCAADVADCRALLNRYGGPLCGVLHKSNRGAADTAWHAP